MHNILSFKARSAPCTGDGGRSLLRLYIMSFKKESLSDVRFHAAARLGDLIGLRYWLDSGKVHVDSRDKDGTTPLMISAAAGHIECCRELVMHGADAKQRRKTGAGSLFLAAQGGFNDIVNLLIRAGAPVNGRCKDGGTALMVAAQQGYTDVCIQLINSGADVHLKMKDGATCLFLAAQNGHAKIVALILAAAAGSTQAIATINNRRLDGATPLWMAAQMGHEDVIRLLIKAKANPAISRNDGVSPLLKACQKGHVGAVRELLKASPSLDLCQNGDSPLYAAVVRRDVPLTRMLMRAGADPHLSSTRSSISPSALAKKLNIWEIELLFSDSVDKYGGSASPSPELV